MSTVEALIRIKFNGPKDLKEFDAWKYVRKFIQDGHSRANDESRRGRKRSRGGESEESDEIIGIESANSLPVETGLAERASEDEITLRGLIFDGDEMDVTNLEYVEIDDDDAGDEINSWF